MTARVRRRRFQGNRCPLCARNRGLWRKAKWLNRQEFVVGWTDPEGSRPHLRALLLGYYTDAGKVIYAGRVGTECRTRCSPICADPSNPWREQGRRLTRHHRARPALDRRSSFLANIGSPAGGQERASRPDRVRLSGLSSPSAPPSITVESSSTVTGYWNAGDEQFRCHETSPRGGGDNLEKRRRRLGKARGKSARGGTS